MPIPTHSKISILPDSLISQIAAGEVVERPASVVKELLENSIDAGANRIVIEIEAAGTELIRVSDNGRGMDKDEIQLALKRHSTSKISSLDDLSNISTLGFRGEALPSIASVSRMKLEPNPSAGLKVEVRGLFYNTPARKKFLKSPATETGQIGDIIAKYILAYPNIAFKFSSDEKLLLASNGTGKLSDSCIAVYGAELFKELVAVAFEGGGLRVEGFVSQPTLSRVGKDYETFFVNGRYVRNFLLNRALEEVYRTLIPRGRYPAAILLLQVDPKEVDVNVHPAKREVKFLKTNEVMRAVAAAAGQALQKSFPARPSGMEMGAGNGEGLRGYRGQKDSEWKPEMMAVFFPDDQQKKIISPPENFPAADSSLPLAPLYQLNNSYIVATDGNELALIDQHAAHERVLFDQLSGKNYSTISQRLLMAETIELSAKEASTLQKNLALLREIGFELDDFGESSIILRAVPAVSHKLVPKQLFLDLLGEIAEMGKALALTVTRENIRKMLACKSAIKAGDKLTPPEINQLIRALFATPNPQTCPHGRPTMFSISQDEIRKRLSRS